MTSNISQLEYRNVDIKKLAPFIQELVIAAISDCVKAGLDIDMFEGYRPPQRQQYLYEQGRTRVGKRVTWAKPWESFHQYHLAIDVAFGGHKKWYWPDPETPDGKAKWNAVTAIFERHGFTGISKERAHFQLTAGMTEQEAFEIYAKHGMQAVWDIVETRMTLLVNS
jgi:peptidoglycan L-alanyl-D-glutamate endopeptidase CwlK